MNDIRRCRRHVSRVSSVAAIFSGVHGRPLGIGSAVQFLHAAGAGSRRITADGAWVAGASRFLLIYCALPRRGLCQGWRGQHQRGEDESQDTAHTCASQSSISFTMSPMSQNRSVRCAAIAGDMRTLPLIRASYITRRRFWPWSPLGIVFFMPDHGVLQRLNLALDLFDTESGNIDPITALGPGPGASGTPPHKGAVRPGARLSSFRCGL